MIFKFNRDIKYYNIVTNMSFAAITYQNVNYPTKSKANSLVERSHFLDKCLIGVIIGIIILFALTLTIILLVRVKVTKKLEKIAYIDEVTGENTIKKFWQECKVLFAKYSQECYSIVYFDIDRFKYINDTYGYRIGNDLLRYITKCTKDVLYDFETLARLSSDNFIFILKNQNKKEIIDTLERINRNVQTYQIFKDSGLRIVLAFGIYSLPKEKIDFYSALDKANMARKSIKGRHRCSYAFYDQNMHLKLIKEAKIVECMQSALENNEFKPYLQPKFDLTTGNIVGAEALARWCSPVKGVIPPSEFIPIFEKTGFITQVDFSIFEQVCKLLRYMLDNNFNVVPISVNLSRIHIIKPQFVKRLSSIADKYNIPKNLLEIELTETVILENSEDLSKVLNWLKAEGFIISMDDFGTGYSSLNLLKSLPFDVLKIDKSFFNAEKLSQREEILVKDIIIMAHHLRMKVVCEGVETIKQAQVLKNIYCDIAQGYLYAKPMPVNDYLYYIKEKNCQPLLV